MSRCISRALTSGMSGSSSPAKTRVGCRSRGRNGRLVQPAPAVSWCRYPLGGPTRLPSCWRPRSAPDQPAPTRRRCRPRPARGNRGPGSAAASPSARAPKAGRAPSAHPSRSRPAPAAGSGPAGTRRSAGRARRPTRCRARRTARDRARPAARRPAGTAHGTGRAAATGRAADARRVEPDHLDRRVERGDERLEQFQAGADAVDQQQRDPGRPDSRPGALARSGRVAPRPGAAAADLDVLTSGRGRRCRVRRTGPGILQAQPGRAGHRPPLRSASQPA